MEANTQPISGDWVCVFLCAEEYGQTPGVNPRTPSAGTLYPGTPSNPTLVVAIIPLFPRSGVWAVRTQAQGSVKTIVQPVNPTGGRVPSWCRGAGSSPPEDLGIRSMHGCVVHMYGCVVHMHGCVVHMYRCVEREEPLSSLVHMLWGPDIIS